MEGGNLITTIELFYTELLKELKFQTAILKTSCKKQVYYIACNNIIVFSPNTNFYSFLIILYLLLNKYSLGIFL